MTTNSKSESKSALKVLSAGDILFNEGEIAESLFIIQKGQVRLFKPKGKGFVELAVLRAGEVIGEMAYFDEERIGNKRSCSASAITGLEVIEISFTAFGKTMQSLNPWFKTIITTLAARLRKTNIRIRELEENQASLSYGGKHTTYEFMKPIEVMRILGTLFLVFKSHGEIKENSFVLNRKTLLLYTQDMYQIMEVKLESIMNLLVQLGWLEIKNDESNSSNILWMKNIEGLRQVFIYYNSERHLMDDKKINISDKCEMILAEMIESGVSLLQDIPHAKPSGEAKFTKHYNVTSILSELKKKAGVNPDHLDDGRNIGLFGEVVTQNGEILVEVDFPKIEKLYPIIRFMNAIRRSNTEKAPNGA